MAQTIERRVDALEAAHDIGRGECPECGSSGPSGASDTYELVFVDEYEGPEFCPECGRRLVITLTWGELR
jgi:hypothetical protein